MSQIVTYKGKLPIGEQEKIHLSTNNGLTGYKINDFRIISEQPGSGTFELVAKIFLTDQTGSITSTVDFNDTDILAVAFSSGANNASISDNFEDIIIFDKETFNQDIFIYIADAGGNTTPANFYIELEKFAIDLNTSTFHTLKNLRSKTQ
jgi:hypothetical protein